jgi:hypothetical protein
MCWILRWLWLKPQESLADVYGQIWLIPITARGLVSFVEKRWKSQAELLVKEFDLRQRGRLPFLMSFLYLIGSVPGYETSLISVPPQARAFSFFPFECHAREGKHPFSRVKTWIPACAGKTDRSI